jgi:hypothetical protein
MAHTRVLHVERCFHMSKRFAEQVMRDQCTITWVVQGETIRDTTNEERMALRAEQAQKDKLREPLAYSELFGLRYEPRIGGEASARESNSLVWQACKFASEAQV